MCEQAGEKIYKETNPRKSQNHFLNLVKESGEVFANRWGDWEQQKYQKVNEKQLFFRILDDELYNAGSVSNIGFEESDGFRIPDEYLDNQEFVVMRTCHGIGDWIIISVIPRLLKQKYPNSDVPRIFILLKPSLLSANGWDYWQTGTLTF